jgi:hypothetical protein
VSSTVPPFQSPFTVGMIRLESPSCSSYHHHQHHQHPHNTPTEDSSIPLKHTDEQWHQTHHVKGISPPSNRVPVLTRETEYIDKRDISRRATTLRSIYVTINIGVFRNSPCSIFQYHKHG